MNNIFIKKDKGTAGLTILLSLIVILFIIGLILMIFTLMANSLQVATYTSTSVSISNVTTASVVNATGTYTNGYNPSTYRDCSLTITQASYTNATATYLINTGNYTLTNCFINGSTADSYRLNKLWNITGSVTYSADNPSTKTINQTAGALNTVTTYFPLFITIGAMVVLILLTVIIITSIRNSGMIGGMHEGHANVGSA